jgi:dTDP-4-dehydrorhamnose reductase
MSNGGRPEVRALILGATGLVGRYCLRRWSDRAGWRAAGTSHRQAPSGLEPLDLEDAAATRKLIERERPQLVVICASNPFVDYCETHPEETRALNVTATLQAAAAAREVGATAVFFSTDYVFDGEAAPYGEQDSVGPLNEYGRQKAEAERGVAALGPDHLILRVSGVFGWETSRKNFVLQVVDRCRAGKAVQAATDIRYNPTYAANLPDVIAELYENGRRGLYHAAGAEEFTRFDFAQTIARAFGFDASRVEPIGSTALKQPARRPLHSSLRTDKARAHVRAPLWGAAKALAHMKAEEPAWNAYVDAVKAS